MTFNDLNINTPLLNALDELGFKEPTAIQEKVYSVAMSGADVCGVAQTGTGKTFAYLLPCLRQWKFTKDLSPTILVLVPTRELVAQVTADADDLTKYMNVESLGVYGGVNINTQKKAAEGKIDLLAATPGRLFDLVMNGSLKLKNIKKLVIDEVDEMLNLGFRTQLKNILDLLPAKRQNLLFSATLTPEVEELMGIFFNDPVMVEAAPSGTPLENIEQRAYEVPNFNTRLNLLKLLLDTDEEMNKVLIFTGGKRLADELYTALEPLFPEKIGVIHSNKEQNHRFNSVKQFEEGNYRILIATDLIARGIDITDVSHVINFDTPDEPEKYMHRIGRTGRAKKKGIAITFVTEKEKAWRDKIEALMKFAIPDISLPNELEISTELTEDELPKVFMKEIQVKVPKKEDVGPSFHPKSAKNSKTNFVMSRKDRMMKKYGKAKTRGQKPKRKK